MVIFDVDGHECMLLLLITSDFLIHIFKRFKYSYNNNVTTKIAAKEM